MVMGESKGPFPWALIALYAVPIAVLIVLAFFLLKGP